MPPIGSRVPCLVVVLTAIVACATATEPVRPGLAATMQIVAGDAQSGVVGTELAQSLVVHVTDGHGVAVGGQVVNFRVTAGAGSVFAGAAVTNADGVAQERWTLGTAVADSQRVEARAVDPSTGAPLVFATFRAVAQAGPASAVRKASGDSLSAVAGAAVSTLPRVLVVDRYGNPVGGAAVTFTVTAGAGSLTGAGVTTDATGLASPASWTLGIVSGLNTLTATLAGIPSSVTFVATGLAGPATRLTLLQAAAVAHPSVPFAQQPIVRIEDALGNLVAGASDLVTLTVSSGAVMVGAASVNAVNGIATFASAGISGTIGDYTLNFSAAFGGVTRSATQSVSLTPGAAARLLVTTSSASTTVGTPVTVRAQVIDAGGAPVPTNGVSIKWASSGEPGAFGAPTSTTDAAGGAVTSFTPDTLLVAGATTLAAADTAGRTGSVAVTVVAGAAVRLAFDPIVSGYGIGYLVNMDPAVVVRARDRYGNAATKGGNQVTVGLGAYPAGARLLGTVSATMSNGIATFADLRIDVGAAGYTLVASALGLVSATSQSLDVSSVGYIFPPPSSGFGQPLVIGQSLYSPENSRLYRVPSTGGLPVLVAPDDQQAGGASETPIVSDGTSIYYAPQLATGTTAGTYRQSFTIYRVPLSGGTRSVVYHQDATLNWKLQSFAFDTTYFYFSATRNDPAGAPIDSGTYRVTASSGVILRLSNRPLIFAVAQRRLYYFEGKLIKSMSIDGGASDTVVTGTGSGAPFNYPSTPTRALVIANTIYWLERSAIVPYLYRAPLAGGTAQLIGEVLGQVTSLSSDGISLYVNGPASGKTFRFSLATLQSSVIPGEGVTFDNESMYWSNGSIIAKAPK